MQPIILLAIVAVGAIALGSGFLFPTFDINVQNVGVGDADLASPIDPEEGVVDVDIDIDATFNDNATPELLTDDYFDNKVTECSWHIGVNDLAVGETDITEVICKITGVDGQGVPNGVAIAECNEYYGPTFDTNPGPTFGDALVDYPFSEHEFCEPDEAYDGALLIDNVGDVRIVVRGDNPTKQFQPPQ